MPADMHALFQILYFSFLTKNKVSYYFLNYLIVPFNTISLGNNPFLNSCLSSLLPVWFCMTFLCFFQLSYFSNSRYLICIVSLFLFSDSQQRDETNLAQEEQHNVLYLCSYFKKIYLYSDFWFYLRIFNATLNNISPYYSNREYLKKHKEFSLRNGN